MGAISIPPHFLKPETATNIEHRHRQLQADQLGRRTAHAHTLNLPGRGCGREDCARNELGTSSTAEEAPPQGSSARFGGNDPRVAGICVTKT